MTVCFVFSTPIEIGIGIGTIMTETEETDMRTGKETDGIDEIATEREKETEIEQYMTPQTVRKMMMMTTIRVRTAREVVKD